MRTLEDHKRLFEYDRWANEETLASIKNLKAGRARSIQLYSHIVETEILWYQRIRKNYAHIVNVWGNWPLEQAETEAGRMTTEWNTLLANESESFLLNRIAYKNTKGTPFENTVDDILTHVVNHSSYHRGQIAAEVRKAGGEPAYTDYIQYQRTR